MKKKLYQHRKTLISYGGVLAVLLAVGLLWLAMGRGQNPVPVTQPDASVSDGDFQVVSSTDNLSPEEVSIERVRVTGLIHTAEQDGGLGGEGMIQRTQYFHVKVLTGEYKGQEALMSLDLTDITGTGKGVIVAKEGDRLLGYIVRSDDGTLVGVCTGFQRDVPLFWMAVLFVVLLVLFFGRSGIKSISALAVTCLMLIFVMIPLVYNGMDPVLAVAVFGAATIVVTLLLVHGPTAASLAAGCGAVGGVLVSALAAFVMKKLIWLTGTVDEESIGLLYTDNGAKLDVSSIMFAAIVIGSLGGTIDVSVSIASSLDELKGKMGDRIRPRELVRSGMSIGCDIMGASLNTMILAYVGSSFQLLMLFSAYHYSLKEIINNEMIAAELLRSLAGCLGLLMSVPITSLVAAYVTGRGDRGAFRLRERISGRMPAVGEEIRKRLRSLSDIRRQPEEEEEMPVNLFANAQAHYDESEAEAQSEDGEGE